MIPPDVMALFLKTERFVKEMMPQVIEQYVPTPQFKIHSIKIPTSKVCGSGLDSEVRLRMFVQEFVAVLAKVEPFNQPMSPPMSGTGAEGIVCKAQDRSYLMVVHFDPSNLGTVLTLACCGGR